MPAIGTSQKDLGTDDFVDFSDLDQIPRPIGVSGFNFPRRLLKKKVNGRLVLMLKLDERGEVLDVQLDSSNLPAFDDFVLGGYRLPQSWAEASERHQLLYTDRPRNLQR